MRYEPHRTNVLPEIGGDFPITDELPAVRPKGRAPSGRSFLIVIGSLLIAGIIAIAAIVLIGTQQTDEAASTDDDEPATTPVSTPDEDGGSKANALDDEQPTYWQVIGVADGLNVRSGPGTTNDIVGALRLGDRHIFGTGQRAEVNGAEWKQILFGDDDTTGWVSARFLAEDTAPGDAEPTATAVATETSVVCFRSDGTPAQFARIVFSDRTDISGIVRTVASDTTVDQSVAGTLDSGRAEVTLTNTGSGAIQRQSWSFAPASVDLGNGRSLMVVGCDAIASQLS